MKVSFSSVQRKLIRTILSGLMLIALSGTTLLLADKQFKTHTAIKEDDPAKSAPPLVNNLDKETPPPMTIQEEQMSQIINQTPLTTSVFTITMDYANNTFIVQILQPSEQNLPKFEKWIVDNNYTQIPREKFDIKYQ